MKKALVLSLVLAAGILFSFTASAFFNFGYTHGIPDNEAEVYAGFNFGPKNSEFNIDFYLGDLWGVDPAWPNDSLVFLGLEAFYVGVSGVLDAEVGAYLESSPLVGWPAVALADVGFYGDFTVHVLPDGPITWDLFASVNLDVTGGILGLNAEVGFEVDI